MYHTIFAKTQTWKKKTKREIEIKIHVENGSKINTVVEIKIWGKDERSNEWNKINIESFADSQNRSKINKCISCASGRAPATRKEWIESKNEVHCVKMIAVNSHILQADWTTSRTAERKKSTAHIGDDRNDVSPNTKYASTWCDT